MKKIIKELLPYVVIFLVVVLIRTFLITPVTVVGDSMVPTLHNKELLLLSKISYKVHDIERFDVVVIKDEDWIIKRIIGLPGDDVSYSDNTLYINSEIIKDEYAYGDTRDFNLNDICIAGLNNDRDVNCPINKIPDGYYLVLGDNRKISKDSTTIGLIPYNEIQGKAIVRIWPLNKISVLN